MPVIAILIDGARDLCTRSAMRYVVGHDGEPWIATCRELRLAPGLIYVPRAIYKASDLGPDFVPHAVTSEVMSTSSM